MIYDLPRMIAGFGPVPERRSEDLRPEGTEKSQIINHTS